MDSMNKLNINHHFKRESKIMIWGVVLPIILGVLAAFIVPWFLTFMQVDSCLDSGGSYDYENCRCDHDNNHEFKKMHNCS